MNQDEQFRTRVLQLVAEGKLTPEEAEKLLGEKVKASASESADSVAAESDPASSGPVQLEKSADRAPTTAHPEVMSYRYDGEVPPRLHLSVQGYSLTVRVDDTVTSPTLTASHPDSLELVGSPQGWRVARTPLRLEEGGSNWLERVLSGFAQESNLRGDLVIPSNIVEVSAKVQGGNLTIDPLLATVDAVVQGGNLSLGDATNLQAKIQGGNLKWRATVHDGEHNLKVQGGNVNLELGASSSVRLEGDVVAGNLSTSGFTVTKTARDFVSASYEGTLGDGRAKIDIKVQGGNARVVSA